MVSNKNKVYEKLGISEVINARGYVTHLGSSIMDPEVLEAMAEASKSFVEMDKLKDRAGEIIAKITGSEAACVTAGAAAGILGAASAQRHHRTVQCPAATGSGSAEPHRSRRIA